jgi:hypothetical protein
MGWWCYQGPTPQKFWTVRATWLDSGNDLVPRVALVAGDSLTESLASAVVKRSLDEAVGGLLKSIYADSGQCLAEMLANSE